MCRYSLPSMGESKRRQESDPSYGKVKKQPPKKPFKLSQIFNISKVSRLEWIVWAVMLGSSAAWIIQSFLAQPGAT